MNILIQVIFKQKGLNLWQLQYGKSGAIQPVYRKGYQLPSVHLCVWEYHVV